MSEKQIPIDLYPQRDGHGGDSGCECDLVGGDPECKVQPPYESTADYCARLRNRTSTAESIIRDLAQALQHYVDAFGGLHEEECPTDDTCDCKWKPINDMTNAALSRVSKEIRP